jgi:uncharacterized membrane protein YfcA
MLFSLGFGLAAAAAGAIASLSGFGIGSVLTPLLAWRAGTKLAVAAVSVPHLLATALRFRMTREHVNRRVLLTFGLASAAGGLLGALLHARVESRGLSLVLGALLLFAGVMGLTGLGRRLRFSGAWAWVAGALSGGFGGLVGNQGGIRSAAMLGFDVPKDEFIATATAVALLVDGARMPVYLATQGRALLGVWPLLAIGGAGALVGTVFGRRALARVPEALYRRLVSLLIAALGAALLLGLGA